MSACQNWRANPGAPVRFCREAGAPTKRTNAARVRRAAFLMCIPIVGSRPLRGDAAGASARSGHALKLLPQPQVEVEFGLLNTNPEPMISSL